MRISCAGQHNLTAVAAAVRVSVWNGVASAVPRAAPRARCVMQLPFVSVAKNALVAVDFTTIFTSFAMYKLWVFFLFFSHAVAHIICTMKTSSFA
jgi:hypothetical protein